MSPLSSLLPGSPSAWGRLDCSRIAVRRWRPGLVLRHHLLKREDVLYWLCRVSSINNKTANEITLCDVNIRNLLTADLAQSRKVISHHCDPFLLEEVWIMILGGQVRCVWWHRIDTRKEMVPDLMWSACCELALKPKYIGHSSKTVITHVVCGRFLLYVYKLNLQARWTHYDTA